MSTFVELVLLNVAAVPELVEVRKSWGSEMFTLDPPEYEFGVLRWRSSPLTANAKQFLGADLFADHACLVLDDGVVCEWERGALGAAAEHGLRQLFARLSAAGQAWAVVYNTSTNDSRIVSRYLPDDAFARIDEAVRHQSGWIGCVVSAAFGA